MVPDSVRRRVEAILDREARRMLDEELAAAQRHLNSAGPAAGTDDDTIDRRQDHVTPAGERQPIPIDRHS